MKVLQVRTHELLVLVGQLHFDGQRLPVAAHSQRNDAARRSFVDHPLQLRLALDRRAIQSEDDVMLLDAGLAGRSILVNHRYLDTLFFFQLQGAQAFRGDVRDVDAQVGIGAAVFAGEYPRPVRRVRRHVLRRVRKGKQQRQQHDASHNVFTHGHSPTRKFLIVDF